MKLLILMFSIWLFLASSCTRDEKPEIVVPIGPTTTPIPLPGSTAREQLRNDLVNEAIRFAAAGCPGIDEKLSGPPTRVLAALTNSAAAGGLVNPEADLQGESGPGGGGVTAWVVAIEGSSIPVFGEDPWVGANIRTFIFVVNFFTPELTGCVVRDAPMPLGYKDQFRGGFEFEILLDARP